MTRNLILTLLLVIAGCLSAQNLYFPPNPNMGEDWDTTSMASLNWNAAYSDTLCDFLEEKETKAFLVLKDGKMVMEKYFGTFEQDSAWYWASAGKTLAAFLVGKAQEEGHLSITDPVSAYLGTGWTSCDSLDEANISIRHQLTMTSGLLDSLVDVHCTDPGCLECYKEPGTRWAYHNAPYTLTHNVVENATGLKFNTYTYQQLHQPIGMSGLWIWLGYNHVYLSRARSMARFGLMMLAGGTWAGDTMMHDRQYFNSMITPSQSINTSYGYLWWLNGQSSHMVPGYQQVLPGPLIPNAPDDLYAGLGANDQKLYVVPSENLVVVRMGHDAGSPLIDPLQFDNLLWMHLNKLMTTPTGISPQKQAELRLFPNPAAARFRVESEVPVKAVSIFSLSGKKLMSGAEPAISVAALSAGIYLVSIQLVDGSTAVKRLVKE